MAFKINGTFFLISIAIAVGILTDILLNSTKPLSNFHKDRSSNFTQLSGQHGFVTEEHTVTTKDGYFLTIFRMKGKNCVEFNRFPVLLMHGLIQSADSWIDAGPDAGLAYLIAAECHDLWVGNLRGNYYGRRHVTLDPDKDAEFWQFSADEIGLYDIPDTIDYVLKSTKKEKLNYVGFSQGGGTFAIMCSERPGYCDKANVFIALAPATKIFNLKSRPVRALFKSFNQLQGALSLAGVQEVFARGALVQSGLELLCRFSPSFYEFCDTAIRFLDTFHPGSLDDETLQLLATHFPGGTSVRTLARYGQSLREDNFQKYDYGKSKNIAIYGTQQPPIYNLSAVTAPVALFYGRNDHLVDTKDIFWLAERLPHVTKIEIPDPLWNHFDMTYSRNTKKFLFPEIRKYF